MNNFKGKYGEKKFIGRSYWGDTYTAINYETKEVVNLNVIISNSSNKEYMDSLKEEIQILKSMGNPNLIRINTIEDIMGDECAYPYIESENFPGISLKEKLKDKTFSEEEAINILKQVVEGLRDFHFKNIAHKKLSYDNIYIDEKGTIKIDTLAYLARKDFTKRSKKDFSCEEDIYSLGVILYQLITGDHSFKLGKYKSRISDKDILYIIDKCTNKKLGIYEDLSELIIDMEDYLEYDENSTKVVTKKSSHKKTPLLVMAALGLCIVGILITTMIINGGSLLNKKNEEEKLAKLQTINQTEKKEPKDKETQKAEPKSDSDSDKDKNSIQPVYDNSSKKTSNNYYPSNRNNTGNNNGNQSSKEDDKDDTIKPEKDKEEKSEPEQTPDTTPQPNPDSGLDNEDEDTDM